MYIAGVHVERRKGSRKPAIQSRPRAKEMDVMAIIDCHSSGKRTQAVCPKERAAISKERIDNSTPTGRTLPRESTVVSGHEGTGRPPGAETERQEYPC